MKRITFLTLKVGRLDFVSRLIFGKRVKNHYFILKVASLFHITEEKESPIRVIAAQKSTHLEGIETGIAIFSRQTTVNYNRKVER